MKPLFEFSTLRLHRPRSYTLISAFLWFLILFSALELILRLEYVHHQLAYPRMGSRHSQLGQKLRMLEEHINVEGSLDCVVIGSSVVDNGFDPIAFSQAYQLTVGDDLTCFNFGIDAIPAATAGVLAEILVDMYQPDILIYGMDGRDFAVAHDNKETTVVLDSPWIQYRANNFNLKGWLLDHAYTYRYRRALQRLMRLDSQGALKHPPRELTKLGQQPLYGVDMNVHNPPEPEDDSFQVRVLSNLLGNFDIVSENMVGFTQLMELNSHEVHVFVVMMPVADGYYSFYGNGRSDYDSFVETVAELATDQNVAFLRPLPAESIPADGWFDYMHVNATGAKVFSDWLGREIGLQIANQNEYP